MALEIKTINLGFVNCYLVKTDAGFILVDTGMPSSRKTVEKELEKAGCLPGSLNLIIATHGDIDHTGNCAYLREKYKTKIAMHKDDSYMVENGDMAAKRKVKSVFMRLMHVFMSRSKKFREVLNSFEKFKPDMYLDEGQSLKEFGFDAKVLHIPGHTKGSIGILTSENDFFAGDTINNHGWAIIIMDEKELAESAKRLKDLNMRNVYQGHGKPFKMETFKA
jgi:glyoxylase-like metal-dependent hydrolase (beta-lactamase superfamily II)